MWPKEVEQTLPGGKAPGVGEILFDKFHKQAGNSCQDREGDANSQ